MHRHQIANDEPWNVSLHLVLWCHIPIPATHCSSPFSTCPTSSMVVKETMKNAYLLSSMERQGFLCAVDKPSSSSTLLPYIITVVILVFLTVVLSLNIVILRIPLMDRAKTWIWEVYKLEQDFGSVLDIPCPWHKLEKQVRAQTKFNEFDFTDIDLSLVILSPRLYCTYTG